MLDRPRLLFVCSYLIAFLMTLPAAFGYTWGKEGLYVGTNLAGIAASAVVSSGVSASENLIL